MLQPTKFGKYLLLERIAVGGMAEVFVAKAFGAEGFERLLAIKKILPTLGEDAEFVAMFVDEARIAVQLAHANIVQVLELGRHEGNLYIAMEYISGRDLRQLSERYRKRNQQMPVAQSCRIVADVCEALDYAHRKCDASGRPLGIVHRDVSPQNVLVSFEGHVKLIDFGIAKAESRLQRTQAGILKGKFSYMSPEQVKGHPIDGRSDVFAAGILLWELICGQKLFAGESDFAILEKVRNGIVPPPRSVTRACPEGLERVILKALATEPSQRYQAASELHDDLMRFAVIGDTVCGSRQLAEWMRQELSADWEKEQARLRTWVSVGDTTSDVTPVDPFPGPALLNAMEAASTLVASELPTQKMDEAELARAEEQLAERKDGDPARTPAPRHPGRRWLIYAAVPVLAALAALLWMLALQRGARPGKVVVTPSPLVPAELYIDGKPAGPLPPFVHVVPAGKHRIEVRADGYKAFSTDVTVPPGGPPVQVAVELP